MSTSANGCSKPPADARPARVAPAAGKAKPTVAVKPVVPAKPVHIPPPGRAPVTGTVPLAQTHQPSPPNPCSQQPHPNAAGQQVGPQQQPAVASLVSAQQQRNVKVASLSSNYASGGSPMASTTVQINHHSISHPNNNDNQPNHQDTHNVDAPKAATVAKQQSSSSNSHHQRLPSSGGGQSGPLVICRGRTPSNASAGGCSTSGSDIDRTSAQLEAIKQKSLDLDSRLPAHFHGSDSLDGDGSRMAGSGSSYHHGNQPRAPSKFFQQSSKQLEEILAQRLEKEAMQRSGAGGGRKGSGSMGGGGSGSTVSTGSKQTNASGGSGGGGGGVGVGGKSSAGDGTGGGAAAVQKMLNDEMKRHCRIIQEKHLIERRWPQLAYGAGGVHEAPIDEEMHHITVRGAGSLPSHSLGLTKIRPSIFGDQSGKDGGIGHRRHGSCASATGGDAHQLDNPDDNTLIYRDGALVSGALDTLIQHMVPTADYYPDKSYLFAFLLSARLFVRPHQLLDRVCRLCDTQQQLGLELAPVATSSPPPSIVQPPPATPPLPPTADSNRRFASNFVRLLADWIDTFPYDFRDERLMQHVRRMTQKCIQLDTSRRRDISSMLQTLLHRLTLLDQYEEYLGRVQCGADAAAKATGPATATGTGIGGIPADDQHHHHTHHASPYPQVVDFTEVCTGATQLAHQLTHIELERLSHIGPEEFVQAFAKEQQCPADAGGGGKDASTGDQQQQQQQQSAGSDIKKTRNLESYVAWFNRLSYLVASEIVKHPKKKQRVRVIEYWIETARECFNIGNFNSLMAIIAGLNMSPISRLKKTWAKAQSAKFMVLEHQMDPTSNFHSYRSTLKAAMWRSAGATDERQRIVVPFFSLLVKDLYFLNEGCANKLPSGHINFDKSWQLAKQVQEFIGWKQVQCTFERQSRITWMLQTAAILSENALALASFECEPPDSATEKDRYKALKAEIAAAAAAASHTHHQASFASMVTMSSSSGASLPSSAGSASGGGGGGGHPTAAGGER